MPVEVAIDLVVGPVYHRALIVDGPIEAGLVDAIVDAVVATDPAPG